jgi:hypothetical protein
MEVMAVVQVTVQVYVVVPAAPVVVRKQWIIVVATEAELERIPRQVAKREVTGSVVVAKVVMAIPGSHPQMKEGAGDVDHRAGVIPPAGCVGEVAVNIGRSIK